MGVEAATVTRRMPPVLNPPHPVMVWSCLTRSAHAGGVLGQIRVPFGRPAQGCFAGPFWPALDIPVASQTFLRAAWHSHVESAVQFAESGPVQWQQAGNGPASASIMTTPGWEILDPLFVTLSFPPRLLRLRIAPA